MISALFIIAHNEKEPRTPGQQQEHAGRDRLLSAAGGADTDAAGEPPILPVGSSYRHALIQHLSERGRAVPPQALHGEAEHGERSSTDLHADRRQGSTTILVGVLGEG